jgi:hypothetical protein
MLFFVTDRYMPHLIQDKNIIFISFAMARLTMFTTGTETINVGLVKRFWGNPIVFGALIHLTNDFLVTKLDIMYGCSLSSLKKNHEYDMNHRVQEVIYPIKFDNLDDFSRLKYDIGEPMNAQVYLFNPNNKRFKYPLHWSRRIVEGVNKQAFKQAVEIVT